MRNLWLLVAVLFLGACSVRTYTVEKPRVDTDIEGNQGYLTGTPTEIEKPKTNLKKTRTISVMEVEFGPKYKGEEDQEAEGNRGYVVGESKEAEAEEVSFEEEVEEVVMIRPEREVSSSEKEYKYYTIQKNDTLQKISYKFYGTTKKWMMIYEENKDVLKSPNNIFPGQKIKIPIN